MQVPQPPPRDHESGGRPGSGGRSIRTGWAEQKNIFESKFDEGKVSDEKCLDDSPEIDVDEESMPDVKPSVTRPAPKLAFQVQQPNFEHKEQEEAEAVLQTREDTEGYKQAMWEGKSNILVAVRVRPLSKTENQRGHRSILEVMDGKVVVVKDPKEKENASDILRQNRSREKRYAFDYAFGPGASSETVFRNTTEFLIDGVLGGFNATVFAYGATGAGKTFTMLGTETHPGIMFQTLSALFNRASEIEEDKSQGLEYKISLSYLEVYNELIRDLLTTSGEYLDLREDPIKGPTVAGISEIGVDTPEHVMRLLREGNKRRTQESTAANKESSRSHAVLQIIVEQRDTAPGVEASVKIGKLSMIDLAGSERASNTQNRGLRLIEGANINRSLLALGNCINALGKSKGGGGYIPYRDSKLTRLLKDSLRGNCRTVMITNVSPASFHFEETINSLKYANRAKDIKTNVKRNVLNVKYHISEYVSLIKGLKGEIAMLRGQLTNSDNDAGMGGSAAAPIAIDPGIQIAINSSQREDIRHSQIFNQLRTAIVANFKERMQLRRGQIEIESINVQNHIEIERRQATIARLEADLDMMGEENDELSGFDDDLDDEIDENIGVTIGDEIDGEDSDIVIIEEEEEVEDDHASPQDDEEDEDQIIDVEDEVGDVDGDADVEEGDVSFEGKKAEHSPRGSKELKRKAGHPRRKAPKRVSARQRRKWAIKTTQKEIEAMRSAMEANNKVKDDIIRRLDENRKQSEEMHHDLSRRAKSNERRALMELEYRVLQVELEKLELERSTMLQEMVVKQKNQILIEAKQQLRLRDMIIAAQRQLLEQNHIHMGAKLQRMFERLVPMEAFWGTRGNDDEDDDMDGSDEQKSLIAQVHSELHKVSQSGDDWGVSAAVFPESKLKSIQTVTYNPTASVRAGAAVEAAAHAPRKSVAAADPSKSPRASDKHSHSRASSNKPAKVKRSKSSAYVSETNRIKNRLQSERKRRRQRRMQRYRENSDHSSIQERHAVGADDVSKDGLPTLNLDGGALENESRDTSRNRERAKAKALQKRVLSASGKQWADRLKMYLVTPRRKHNKSSNRSSSTKKAAEGFFSPRTRKQADTTTDSGTAETSSAPGVVKRIANVMKGSKFSAPSPQQAPLPPPPPRRSSIEGKSAESPPRDRFFGSPEGRIENDENKMGTPLPQIKTKGRWSPVNSPENQRGRRRHQHNDFKVDDEKKGGKGIRPVLHRLNAKLRRGRRRSREPGDRSREPNKNRNSSAVL